MAWMLELLGHEKHVKISSAKGGQHECIGA